MNLESSSRHVLGSLARFSRFAAPRVLRPYQLEAGEAIVRSVLRREGKTFTVCMARQSGKNELAAQIEAYLLHLHALEGGQIVKAAPSFRPQIVNSQLRLREILSTPFSRGLWQEKYGYMLELGRARIVFFSADPAANVVGATASLLLEIDEAQDVDQAAYWRDFRPMASTANATTVLYGTPWTDDNILEEQRTRNREHERRTGERLSFEAPWTTLAALSPAYGTFVRGEIDRLGEAHPTIRTQYLLQPVEGAGRLFTNRLIAGMRGDHEPQTGPILGNTYVAGIDVAGQIADPTSTRDSDRLLNQRDETVITIAHVVWSDDSPRRTQSSLPPEEEAHSFAGRPPTAPVSPTDDDERNDASGLPRIRVVALYRWRGISHVEQYHRMIRLLRDLWSPMKICIDATGIGAGLASFLYRAMPTRVEPVGFTAGSKSQLGFGLLAAAETQRLTIHRDDGDPSVRELCDQLRAVRYHLGHAEEMSFSVPAAQGHDDMVMSLALTVRAAGSISEPGAGILLRAAPDADAFGW